MKALITGASSGIGRELAIILDKMGYDIIAVTRREDKLNELKTILNNNTQIYVADISKKEECISLFSQFPDIDILINNAGIGVFGEFSKTNLDEEIKMLDLNINATHILTKLYLKEFIKKDSGYILNVSSSAAFFTGPLFSGYYASKAYIYRLTRAISRELKATGSNVSVSLLCPGPVDTEFNEKSGVHAGPGALSANTVAKYATKKMFRKKLIIIPGFTTKLTRLTAKLLPDCLSERSVYRIQKKKENKNARL